MNFSSFSPSHHPICRYNDSHPIVAVTKKSFVFVWWWVSHSRSRKKNFQWFSFLIFRGIAAAILLLKKSEKNCRYGEGWRVGLGCVWKKTKKYNKAIWCLPFGSQQHFLSFTAITAKRKKRERNIVVWWNGAYDGGCHKRMKRNIASVFSLCW